MTFFRPTGRGSPNPNDPIASKLNALPKFVASHTRNTFTWHKSAHVQDVVKEIAGIKQRFTREVQVHGSCGLAQTLIEHNLIDEYRLLDLPRDTRHRQAALRHWRRARHAQASEFHYYEHGCGDQRLSPWWPLQDRLFCAGVNRPLASTTAHR